MTNHYDLLKRARFFLENRATVDSEDPPISPIDLATIRLLSRDEILHMHDPSAFTDEARLPKLLWGHESDINSKFWALNAELYFT